VTHHADRRLRTHRAVTRDGQTEQHTVDDPLQYLHDLLGSYRAPHVAGCLGFAAAQSGLYVMLKSRKNHSWPLSSGKTESPQGSSDPAELVRSLLGDEANSGRGSVGRGRVDGSEAEPQLATQIQIRLDELKARAVRSR